LFSFYELDHLTTTRQDLEESVAAPLDVAISNRDAMKYMVS